MKHIIAIAFLMTSMTAAADFVDRQGREWMRADATFAFAGLLPALCNPECSGVVTRYTYDVRTNSMTNPVQFSLDGWVFAGKDDVQSVYDEVSINFLSLFGVSYQFVTTYSYSAGLIGMTSTLEPESGQRYYFSYSEGHNMVSFNFSAGFQLGFTTGSFPGRIGAFLYRPAAQPKNCAFNGRELLDGESVTAYASAAVAFGQTCVSEQRVCNNGVLSGTYGNASCTVNAPLNCSYNGQTVLHGDSVTGYLQSLVAYGGTCASVTRTCYNGSLGGAIYPACSVSTRPSTPPGYRCRWKKGVWTCEKRD